MNDDLDSRLDEALEESFPASDSVALTPDPEPWDNQERNRFEITLDGHLSVIEYIRKPGAIDLIHTGVPEELRGRGVANTLAQFAFETARAEGIKVIPDCPFIKVYLRRHPEYADLIA